MSSHVRAVVAHYDERAASYDDSTFHRELTSAIAAMPEVAAARSVLDVATGTGLMLRALAARRTGAVLAGTDISPGMLAVARQALPDAHLALAEAARSPLRDASVDLVTCITALHLFEDPDAVFSDWARVLTPRGLAVTATFAPSGAPVADHRTDFVRRHDAFRTPALVAAAAAPNGFRLLRHQRWSHLDDRLVICVLDRNR